MSSKSTAVTVPVAVQSDSLDAPMEHRRWHGLFKNINEEHGFRKLTVEGNIPDDINGVLYQNGPGEFSAQGLMYGHLFDGDGLIRAIKIQHAKAEGATKLVQSEGLLEERKAGKPLYSGIGTTLKGLQPTQRRISRLLQKKSPFKNTANTSVLFWQNKLFALLEADFPTEIDPDTLETKGESSLGGAVRSSFSAHPHWVSERSCGYSFGIRVTRSNAVIDIYELPRSTPCKHITSIKLDRRPIGYVHDFIATPDYLIFFIPPLHLPNKKIIDLTLGDAVYPLMEWRKELGTEVIIVPIDNPKRLIRFKTDPFFAIHFANAYQEKGVLVVDYMHSDSTILYDVIGQSHFGLSNQRILSKYAKVAGSEIGLMKRAHINLADKSISFETLWNETCEFPKINPSFQGSKHQYVYFLQMPEKTRAHSSFFHQIVKLNLATGQSDFLTLGHEQFPLEPVFIKKQSSKEEDEGYLLSMVYDGINDLSYLAIIDAQNIQDGPVAKIHFGQPLPISFHGMWRSL